MGALVDRRSLFATPLFVFDLDETRALAADLATRLLDERTSSAGIVRSNVGGWHSAPDLAQRPEACYRQLFQTVVEHVGNVVATLAGPEHPPPGELRFAVSAWAMIMRDGDYTIVHDHGDAHWSIIYYVDAGDTQVDGHPESGVLVLVDPRRGGRPLPGLPDTSRFLVHPRTGALVVFPAWLQHYVHAYRGARPRIAISANLILRD